MQKSPATKCLSVAAIAAFVCAVPISGQPELKLLPKTASRPATTKAGPRVQPTYGGDNRYFHIIEPPSAFSDLLYRRTPPQQELFSVPTVQHRLEIRKEHSGVMRQLLSHRAKLPWSKETEFLTLRLADISEDPLEQLRLYENVLEHQHGDNEATDLMRRRIFDVHVRLHDFSSAQAQIDYMRIHRRMEPTALASLQRRLDSSEADYKREQH